MRNRVVFTAVLSILALALFVPAWAQEPAAQEPVPEEPEIVLPEVVLEIEDLSVEEIAAGIPEQEEPLILLEEMPLPEPEDIRIEEPVAELTLPQAGGVLPERTKEKNLTFEGVLGAGTRNHLMSSFSLYHYEKQPEARLKFSHDVTDGFSEMDIGTGYSRREDLLSGSLGVSKNRTKAEVEGAFDDRERGLQGNGNYHSKMDRLIEGNANLEYEAGDRFVLRGEGGVSQTSRILTTSDPSPAGADTFREYLVSSGLEGVYSFDKGFIGLAPRYSYRSDLDKLNRTEVLGLFGTELGERSVLEGEAGWFWSDSAGHLFPFSLTLSAYPTELFFLNLSAGYGIFEYNLWDIAENSPLAYTAEGLEDDRGWFFDFNSHITVSQGWVLYGGLAYTAHEKMVTAAASPDNTTGLFAAEQAGIDQLTAEAGIRWNRSIGFSSFLSWKTELLEIPEHYPVNSLNLEINWIEEKGRFGGSVYSVYYTGINDSNQAPVFDVHGFYRITDTIRLGAELDDLLYPLLEEPRYDWYPYMDEGLKFTLKTYFTF